MNGPNRIANIIRTMTAAALAVISAMASADVDKLGFNDWTIEQITVTENGGSGEPAISGTGRWIAFSSNADLIGDNSDSSKEVFLYDTVTRQFQQLSNGTDTAFGSRNASSSYYGRFIVFASTDDPNGDNADASPDILVFDRIRRTLNQITDSESSVPSAPSVSETGRWIAYENRENRENGTFNIALYDQLKDKRVAVTDAQSGNSLVPAISGIGVWITFSSTADLLPGENSDRGLEIFLFNRLKRSFRQITSGSGTGDSGSDDPSINFSGRFIAFESTDKLVPDIDHDGNDEVYLFDRRSGNIRQITNTKAPESGSDPSISANGRRIVFEYTGPDEIDDVVLFDVSTNQFTWITNSVTGFSDEPRISANGKNVVFSSNADLTGGNPELNPEIFVAYQKRSRRRPWDWDVD